MPVNTTPKAAKTPAPEAAPKDKAPAAAEVAPQSIALELAKIKRWAILGENRVYEFGVVYEFEPEHAKRFLAITDDDGFPVWTPERQKKELVRKPDPDLDAETRHAYRERMRVQAETARPAAPAPAPAPAPTIEKKVEPIDISDDDPELKARLDAIDNDNTDGAVSV